MVERVIVSRMFESWAVVTCCMMVFGFCVGQM
jgi:hypothetical protein